MCPTPPDFPNMITTADTLTVGSVTNYKCNLGYDLDSSIVFDMSLVCTVDINNFDAAQWTSSNGEFNLLSKLIKRILKIQNKK